MSNGEMERQPLKEREKKLPKIFATLCAMCLVSMVKHKGWISDFVFIEFRNVVRHLTSDVTTTNDFDSELQRESHAWLRNDHISSIFLPILYWKEGRIPYTLQSLTHHLECSLDARYYQSRWHMTTIYYAEKLPLINSCMILFILPRPEHFLTLLRVGWLWESYIKPICNS